MRKKYIFIHQQIIPEYRIPIFNEILNKYEDCYIIYGNPNKNNSLKNGEITIKEKYIKVKNLFLFRKKDYFLSSIFNLITKFKPKIIITQYSPSNINIFLFYLLRPIFKFKIIGWYHGWNRQKDFSTNKKFYDKLRHYMLKKADGIILYSDDAKLILSEYKDQSKIFVANNTLDTKTYLMFRNKFEKIGRDVLKEKNNFNSKYNIIFSGRLETEKKVEDLILIFKKIKNIINDISLHIIGSGSLENKLKQIVVTENIENIIFYGGIYDVEKTGSMIYCSDIMIIPSGIGLSIVHSFCFECPVVTFEDKYHGPEIIYLNHEKTGFNFGGCSDSKIVQQITEYLYNEKKQIEFRNNVLEVVNTKASIDKMISGLSEAIDYFLK